MEKDRELRLLSSTICTKSKHMINHMNPSGHMAYVEVSVGVFGCLGVWCGVHIIKCTLAAIIIIKKNLTYI